MKPLWAPWRMDYIVSDHEPPECIFCPGDERSEDEARLILHVDSKVIVMMNRYPYVNGHILVAPRRHSADLGGLDDGELHGLISMVRDVTGILRAEINPEGFNIGINLGRVAGAGIEDHVHFHVVPRWNGDTNFMTVLGEVRVIPEHIEETYRRLVPHFAKNRDRKGR
jgi:ATP adenylyltransferase